MSDVVWLYLIVCRLEVGYVCTFALRVMYVGELGYELYVFVDLAVSLWDSLFAAGAELGIRLVGLVVMESLRLEKGYCDYGIDIENIDGVVEVGLGFVVAFGKVAPFIGWDVVVVARADWWIWMVHVLFEDFELLLYGSELLLHNGFWVGYVWVGAFGYIFGVSVGLAMVERDDLDGVIVVWFVDGGFEVDVVG